MSNTVKTTLYQLKRNGKVKVWSIALDGSTLTTSWGQEDGKMQSQDNPVKAKGREGTKSYKTPEEQAQIEYDRIIEKQLERGYVRDKANLVDISDVSGMNFKELPTGFCPPKPIKTPPSNATIAALIDNGNLRVFKKYDGARVLISFDEDGDPHLFTRTLEPLGSGRIPGLINQLKSISKEAGLYNTIFDAELVLNNGEKLSDFDFVNSLMPRTKEETAAQKIAGLHYNQKLAFYVFDVIFFMGKYTLEEPYGQRWSIIERFINEHIRYGGYYGATAIGLPVERRVNSLENWDELQKQLKTNGWEGYVLRDNSAKSQVTMDGKEIRPEGCWKFKLKQEDDFVATGYELGTGKNADRVGKINISQLSPKGTTLDCGSVGIFQGDDSIRDEALNWNYPCVVRVEFERRQKENNEATCKLRFPCVIAKRDDKKPEECIYG